MQSSKKAIIFISLVIFASMTLSFFINAAYAASKPEYVLKFGCGFPMFSTQVGYKKFAKLLGEYTNGRVKVEYYPFPQLGGHSELYQGVREGSIAMAVLCPYANLFPGANVNNMPFTVLDHEMFRRLYKTKEGIMWQLNDKVAKEMGMQLLWFISEGPFGIGNNVRPIRKPEDFKNLKLRTAASPALVKTLSNIAAGQGLQFETIPWDDIYNALSKKVIDGTGTLWGNLIDEKHIEVLKYITDLGYTFDQNFVVINEDLWKKFPDDIKEAFWKASEECFVFLSNKVEADEKIYIQKIENDYKKVEISWLTAKERNVFIKRANAPAIWDEFSKPWIEKNFPGLNMTEKVLKQIAKEHEIYMKERSKSSNGKE